MGDWERNFGAGASAEAVIAGINRFGSDSDLLANSVDSSSAFRQADVLKTDFIAALKSRYAASSISDRSRQLLSNLYEYDGELEHISNAYNLPIEILEIIDYLSEQLSFENFGSASSNHAEERFEWVILMIEAIRPGSHLDHIRYEFAAEMANYVFQQVGHSDYIGREVYDLIICRSRGITPPKEFEKRSTFQALKMINEDLNINDPDLFDEFPEHIIGLCGICKGSSLAVALDYLVAYRAEVEKNYEGKKIFVSYYEKRLREFISNAMFSQLYRVDLNSRLI